MATTPTTIRVNRPMSNQEAAPPSLADGIRSVLPPHSHFDTPVPGSRSRGDSFCGMWTTPSGTWSIRYAGARTAAVDLAAAMAGKTPEPSRITVSGPAGTWTFPHDTAMSSIQDFLTCVGAVEQAPPPAQPGFLYVGAVAEDGLSFLKNGEAVTFTTTGQVSRKVAETMFGGPVDGEDGQAAKEFDDARSQMFAAADEARQRVIDAEERLATVDGELRSLRVEAEAQRRAVAYLDRMYRASVLANIVNGPSGQRLVPYAEAARVAARIVGELVTA